MAEAWAEELHLSFSHFISRAPIEVAFSALSFNLNSCGIRQAYHAIRCSRDVDVVFSTHASIDRPLSQALSLIRRCMKTLIQAIEESCSKQGKSKSEITRLVLDSICKATDLQTSLSGLPNLEYLSLCNTNLVSLVGLPALPKLKVLKLSDNRIPGSHLEHLSVLVSSKLSHLDLAGNAGISKLEQLKPLSSLKQLKRLDLDGCPVKDNTPDFNKKLFEMIKELEYLDNIDKSGAERDAEEEEEEDDDEDYEEGDDGGAEGEEEVSDSALVTLTSPYLS